LAKTEEADGEITIEQEASYFNEVFEIGDSFSESKYFDPNETERRSFL